MSIWQWILVLLPVIRFGAGLNEAIKDKKPEERKEAVIGKLIALLLIFIGIEFVMWKAGVLIIR